MGLGGRCGLGPLYRAGSRALRGRRSVLRSRTGAVGLGNGRGRVGQGRRDLLGVDLDDGAALALLVVERALLEPPRSR